MASDTAGRQEDARKILCSCVCERILEDKSKTVEKAIYEAIQQAVYFSLSQLEERMVDFIRDLINTRESLDRILTLNRHMEDYLMQSYRQKVSSLQPGQTNQGCNTRDAHIDAIRKKSVDLTRGLQLEGTNLLDRLHEQDALSDTDRQSILAHTTSRRKNEAFLAYICGRFTYTGFKNTFLPALREDDIHMQLALDMERELELVKQCLHERKCTFCKVRDRVDVRKLGEGLYQTGSVPESLSQDLRNSSLANSNKWKALLRTVTDPCVMLEALQRKYPQFYQEFRHTGHHPLHCSCDNSSSLVNQFDPLDMDDVTSDPDVARVDDLMSELSEISTNCTGTSYHRKGYFAKKTHVKRRTSPKIYFQPLIRYLNPHLSQLDMEILHG